MTRGFLGQGDGHDVLALRTVTPWCRLCVRPPVVSWGCRLRLLYRLGHLVEERLQLAGVLGAELLADLLFDLHDHGVGLAQGVVAGVGEVEFLHVAVAWVRPAFQLAPVLQAGHQGGHGLRGDVQAAGQLRSGQAGIGVDGDERA